MKYFRVLKYFLRPLKLFKSCDCRMVKSDSVRFSRRQNKTFFKKIKGFLSLIYCPLKHATIRVGLTITRVKCDSLSEETISSIIITLLIGDNTPQIPSGWVVFVNFKYPIDILAGLFEIFGAI